MTGERYAESILTKRFYRCVELNEHIFYRPPSTLVCPRCGIRRDFPEYIKMYVGEDGLG